MLKTLPSPNGGWNARDPLDKMSESDAIEIVNWVPSDKGLVSRSGSVKYCDVTGTVETLVEYRGNSGNKFLCAAGEFIYDITDPNTPTTLKSGLSSALWQFVNHSSRVILVNGVDTPQVYDGSTLTDFTDTNTVGAADFIGCNSFKGRCFYWKEGEAKYYYAAAGSFQGALTEFDLSTVAQKGGQLINMLTWTLDSGEGMDDFAVFVMSTGETLVYSGSDPGSASDWSLVGRFNIGEPFSYRGNARLGSDEVLITKDGYINISSALQQGRVDPNRNLSNKIIYAAKEVAAKYSGNSHWQAILYPRGSMFIINVPKVDNAEYEQHVFVTSTGKWTKFKGWPARCFGIFQDRLYFGAKDKVVQCDIGTNDEQGSINLSCIPAYTHLGSRDINKQVTAVKTITNLINTDAIGISTTADYRRPKTPVYGLASTSTDSTWDVANWDVAKWATPLGFVDPSFRLVQEYGVAFTFQMIMDIQGVNAEWYQTQIMFNKGGVI